MMKILLAIDSFKESMSSLEAADAFEKGFARALPGTRFVKMCVSDGGEGFTDAFLSNRGGKQIKTASCNARGRSLTATYGLFNGNKSAVIEMARASGLALLDTADRNPLKTSTYGTGLLIDAALKKGVREIIVGIGGSATNDGGTGMAQALGALFFDKSNSLIKKPLTGADLSSIARIDVAPFRARLKNVRVRTACDVDNPMTGPQGSSAVYGPQKGATLAMVKTLDAGLRNLCHIIRRDLSLDVEKIPGSGAAGGLGGGLMAFLDAKLEPGIAIVLSAGGFREKARGCSLVVTGEGRIDFQTVRNKAPVGVAREAKKLGLPVIAVAGMLGRGADAVLPLGIDALFTITPGPIPLDQAIKDGPANMERLAYHLGKIYSIKG